MAIMTVATLLEFIHSHHFHHQTRPPREVLSPLARASLRVILLPGKPCLLPALEHRLNKVLAETIE